MSTVTRISTGVKNTAGVFWIVSLGILAACNRTPISNNPAISNTHAVTASRTAPNANTPSSSPSIANALPARHGSERTSLGPDTRSRLLPKAFANATYTQAGAGLSAKTPQISLPTNTRSTEPQHAMPQDWTYPASPWFNSWGLNNNAQELLNLIQNAAAWSMDSNWLHYKELTTLLSAPWNPATASSMEGLLNSSFKRYITEISSGSVNPLKAQKAWFQKPETIDFDTLLAEMITYPDKLSWLFVSLQHTAEIQQRTLQAIAWHEKVEHAGGWMQIPKGEKLELGSVEFRVEMLRNRLQQSGDYPRRSNTSDFRSTTEGLFDLPLQQALISFQQRHGLSDDGVMGPATLTALNVTAAERVMQLKLNLERQRWMINDPGETHIITNIADYRMNLIESGKVVLDMPVVVGKYKNKTPVFSDEMEYLVVNPTWTVPRSIIRKELVPKEQRNPGSLRRSGFDVLQHNGRVIDNSSVSSSEWHQKPFPYALRQKAGKNNALGKVKFMMPNPYSIYLHDTPAKKLFSRSRRAYSHGCVRLGDPRALANYMLDKNGWSETEIDRVFSKKSTQTVHLDKPIPNHIVYLTAWVDGNGLVQFREDIYQQDSKLAKALERVSKQRTAEMLRNKTDNITTERKLITAME